MSLLPNEVKTEHIANGAVTTEKIANASVTPAKLSFVPPSIARPITPPVSAAEMADGAVTSNKLQDTSVTTPKIADSAILDTKIAPNAVTVSKLDEIAPPTDGQLASFDAASGKFKWIAPPAGGGAKIFTGFYLGDGNPTQAITGVGFRPKFVMVWCATTINHGPFIKTDQDGLLTLLHDNQLQFLLDVDAIISLDADGFTVGSNYDINNGAPRTYNFWCLG